MPSSQRAGRPRGGGAGGKRAAQISGSRETSQNRWKRRSHREKHEKDSHSMGAGSVLWGDGFVTVQSVAFARFHLCNDTHKVQAFVRVD